MANPLFGDIKLPENWKDVCADAYNEYNEEGKTFAFESAVHEGVVMLVGSNKFLTLTDGDRRHIPKLPCGSYDKFFEYKD
jgi:hypothetical protein